MGKFMCQLIYDTKKKKPVQKKCPSEMNLEQSFMVFGLKLYSFVLFGLNTICPKNRRQSKQKQCCLRMIFYFRNTG